MANTGNMRLWVQALRSGEFDQAEGRLHDTDTGGYCCLGVACEIAIRNGVDLVRQLVEGEEKFDGTGTALPPRVRDWLGIEHTDDAVRLRNLTAISYNDNLGYNFDQIADLIEAEYLSGEAEDEVVCVPSL